MPHATFPRRAALLLVLCLAAALCACQAGRSSLPDRPAVESGERQFTAPADGDLIAIFTTSLGEVRAVLYPDEAPMAVANFVGLARSGYYDGTVIWRAEHGFAVQGGDADGTGSGGATIYQNNPIPLEAGSLRHYAGALCAATTKGDPDSGQSQFYFVAALPDSVDEETQAQLSANGYTESEVAAYAAAGGLPYLDNTDTVYGQVYQGMAVVDEMADVETAQDEDGNDTHRPTEDKTITIEKVTIARYPGPTAEELATAESAQPAQ